MKAHKQLDLGKPIYIQLSDQLGIHLHNQIHNQLK
jgi:hypothetical protein